MKTFPLRSPVRRRSALAHAHRASVHGHLQKPINSVILSSRGMTNWLSAQEDEGDDDGDTPHAPTNGGAPGMLPQRSARSTTDGPESPQQASPLRPAGSSALGTLADADAEIERFARMQVIYFTMEAALMPCPSTL
jgi:hypothetical protein